MIAGGSGSAGPTAAKGDIPNGDWPPPSFGELDPPTDDVNCVKSHAQENAAACRANMSARAQSPTTAPMAQDSCLTAEASTSDSPPDTVMSASSQRIVKRGMIMPMIVAGEWLESSEGEHVGIRCHRPDLL
jgi:hypothetical protein